MLKPRPRGSQPANVPCQGRWTSEVRRKELRGIQSDLANYGYGR